MDNSKEFEELMKQSGLMFFQRRRSPSEEIAALEPKVRDLIGEHIERVKWLLSDYDPPVEWLEAEGLLWWKQRCAAQEKLGDWTEEEYSKVTRMPL